MIFINIVVISGRLTKEPVARQTNDGKSIVSFGFAIPRSFKGSGQNADFIDVTAFGGTADFIKKYVTKGTKLNITGSIRQDQWTDKEGNKHQKVGIIAQSVEFGESKREAAQNTESAPTPAPKKDESFLDLPSDTSLDTELPFS